MRLRFVQETRDASPGVLLSLAVYPGSHRQRFRPVNPDEEFWGVDLKAAPRKGKANKALLKALAGFFDVAKSAVSVVRGATSRSKLVAVLGVTPAHVETLLGERGLLN